MEIVFCPLSDLWKRVVTFRGVAQPGSALRSGRRGRGFKSRHPDPFIFPVISPSSASAEAACAMIDHGDGRKYPRYSPAGNNGALIYAKISYSM